MLSLFFFFKYNSSWAEVKVQQTPSIAICHFTTIFFTHQVQYYRENSLTKKWPVQASVAAGSELTTLRSYLCIIDSSILRCSGVLSAGEVAEWYDHREGLAEAVVLIQTSSLASFGIFSLKPDISL